MWYNCVSCIVFRFIELVIVSKCFFFRNNRFELIIINRHKHENMKNGNYKFLMSRRYTIEAYHVACTIEHTYMLLIYQCCIIIRWGPQEKQQPGALKRPKTSPAIYKGPFESEDTLQLYMWAIIMGAFFYSHLINQREYKEYSHMVRLIMSISLKSSFIQLFIPG